MLVWTACLERRTTDSTSLAGPGNTFTCSLLLTLWGKCLVGCVLDFEKLWRGMTRRQQWAGDGDSDCLPLTAFLYAVDLRFFWCKADLFVVCVVVSFGHAFASIFFSSWIFPATLLNLCVRAFVSFKLVATWKGHRCFWDCRLVFVRSLLSST